MFRHRRSGPCALLLVSCCAPVLLNAPGTVDTPIWLEWMDVLHAHGVVAGYPIPRPEYPPLSFVLLWSAERLGHALGLGHFESLKLSLLAALWLSSGIVWAWTRRAGWAALTQAALLLNAVGLGYLDVYGAPGLLACLWALHARRPLLAAASLALSVLCKWQPLVALPLLVPCALAAFPPGPTLGRRLGLLAAACLAPLGAALAVFGLEPLLAFERTLHHPQLSGNALNFNWLSTWMLHLWAPQRFGKLAQGRVFIIETRDFALLLGPRLLFAFAYTAAVWRAWRDPRARTLAGALPLASVGYLAYFMFNPGVHENHIYVGALLALTSAWLAPRAWPRLGLWVVFANVNQVLFYGLTGTGLGVSRVAFGLDTSVPLAAFALGVFARHHWRYVWTRSVPAGARPAGTPTA